MKITSLDCNNECNTTIVNPRNICTVSHIKELNGIYFFTVSFTSGSVASFEFRTYEDASADWEAIETILDRSM